MLRQRVAGDYLQTSAVIEPDGLVRSAVNDPNAYAGPGHRLPARGRALGSSCSRCRTSWIPRTLGVAAADGRSIVSRGWPMPRPATTPARS